MKNLLIRTAQLEDLSRIVDIYNEAIPGRRATADLEPVSLESKLEWFHSHNTPEHLLWVCQRQLQEDAIDGAEETIVGWLSLSAFYGRPAYGATKEVSIYVAEEAQGQGIGSMMMQKLLDHCSSIQVTTLMGFVFGHNESSLALLNKFGFERWGFCPQIAELDGIKRDLVILGKQL